jgi:type IV pilus assembly protein PilV
MRNGIKSLLPLQRQKGVGLIEILVTILILSFGLLGVAGLLTKGVANASSTEARSKANQLIADMADRIRANSAGALSATSPYLTGYGSTLPSTSTIAGQDVVTWKAAISSQLPQGQGSITQVLADRKMIISIRWSGCIGTISDATANACGNASTADSTYETVTMEVRL